MGALGAPSVDKHKTTTCRELELTSSAQKQHKMRALLLSLAAVAVSALYDASDAVIQLTDKDFDKKGELRVVIIAIGAHAYVAKAV